MGIEKYWNASSEREMKLFENEMNNTKMDQNRHPVLLGINTEFNRLCVPTRMRIIFPNNTYFFNK